MVAALPERQLKCSDFRGRKNKKGREKLKGKEGDGMEGEKSEMKGLEWGSTLGKKKKVHKKK